MTIIDAIITVYSDGYFSVVRSSRTLSPSEIRTSRCSRCSEQFEGIFTSCRRYRTITMQAYEYTYTRFRAGRRVLFIYFSFWRVERSTAYVRFAFFFSVKLPHILWQKKKNDGQTRVRVRNP